MEMAAKSKATVELDGFVILILMVYSKAVKAECQDRFFYFWLPNKMDKKIISFILSEEN